MLQAADIDRIARQAAASALPGGSLVDVRGNAALDSEGKDALLITVVIRPEVAAVSGKAALDTIVGIQQGLLQAGEERFPIVDFATEDELMQVDDDP